MAVKLSKYRNHLTVPDITSHGRWAIQKAPPNPTILANAVAREEKTKSCYKCGKPAIYKVFAVKPVRRHVGMCRACYQLRNGKPPANPRQLDTDRSAQRRIMEGEFDGFDSLDLECQPDTSETQDPGEEQDQEVSRFEDEGGQGWTV